MAAPVREPGCLVVERVSWIGMGILLAILPTLSLAAETVDTVRISGAPAFLVSRAAIVSLEGDSVRARLPWSSPTGVVPSAWCEGPDRGLIAIEAGKGGRIVHLGPSLRTVSVHPLPEGMRPSDLPGAKASWDPARGLSIETARPPLRWRLGFLSGPVPPPEPIPAPVRTSP